MFGKAFALSLALHCAVLFVASVVPFTGKTSKQPEPITVYLTAEERSIDTVAGRDKGVLSDRPKREVVREKVTGEKLSSPEAEPGPSKTAGEGAEIIQANSALALCDRASAVHATAAAVNDTAAGVPATVHTIHAPASGVYDTAYAVHDTATAPQALPASSGAASFGGPPHAATEGSPVRGNGGGAIGNKTNASPFDGRASPGHGGASGGGHLRDSHDHISAQFAYIRGLILKNLIYPPGARRTGREGTVTVRFVILETGFTEELRVIESSGYDALDRAAVRTIRFLEPFPKPPARAELVLPITFRLK